MLHVLLVDDTRLNRDGLTELLEREPGIGRVDAVADAEHALQQLGQAVPDVVLVNVATFESVGICRAVANAVPHTGVIALAVSDCDADVVAYAEAGVAGYLLRDESLSTLMAVIGSVVRGETLCSPRIAATLLRRVATLAAERRSWSEPNQLTPREREILQHIDEGLSNKEIARRLSIEVRTVKNHVHNILEKLKVRRRGEAAALLRRHRSEVHIRLPTP